MLAIEIKSLKKKKNTRNGNLNYSLCAYILFGVSLYARIARKFAFNVSVGVGKAHSDQVV